MSSDHRFGVHVRYGFDRTTEAPFGTEGVLKIYQLPSALLIFWDPKDARIDHGRAHPGRFFIGRNSAISNLNDLGKKIIKIRLVKKNTCELVNARTGSQKMLSLQIPPLQYLLDFKPLIFRAA